MRSSGRSSASSRSSSSAVPKCMKRPPDQVPSAVWVGSRGMRQEGYAALWNLAGSAAMARTMTALVAALALLVSGCGGDDKDAYVKQFNSVLASLQHTLDGLGADVSTRNDNAQIARTLDRSAAAVDRAAAQFAGIDTPDDAKSAHEDLIAGMKQLATLFRTGAQEARRDDVASLVSTLRGLNTSPAAAKIERARRELKSKGYQVRGG